MAEGLPERSELMERLGVRAWHAHGWLGHRDSRRPCLIAASAATGLTLVEHSPEASQSVRSVWTAISKRGTASTGSFRGGDPRPGPRCGVASGQLGAGPSRSIPRRGALGASARRASSPARSSCRPGATVRDTAASTRSWPVFSAPVTEPATHSCSPAPETRPSDTGAGRSGMPAMALMSGARRGRCEQRKTASRRGAASGCRWSCAVQPARLRGDRERREQRAAAGAGCVRPIRPAVPNAVVAFVPEFGHDYRVRVRQVLSARRISSRRSRRWIAPRHSPGEHPVSG